MPGERKRYPEQGGQGMITDEQLDRYRVEGTKLRVIRDADPANDVKGIVLAWDANTVLIRKQNRKVLQLDRGYTYQPFEQER
jgi:RNase P/RNase MRP subunit p29